MPKISIIVPVYNSEKYLKDCIQSIILQTYKDFELILVDDGSTDDSYKIMCESKIKDPRIKIFTLQHKGVSYARNYGVGESKGECLCFIDSDDVIDSEYLKEMYELYKKYNATIVECGYKFLNNKNYKKHKKINFKIYNKNQMFERLYSKNGIRTCLIINKLFDRKIFDGIEFENRDCEDEFIIHKLLVKSDINVVIKNSLLYYRYREDSRQRTFNMDRLKVLEIFNERQKILQGRLKEKNKIARLDWLVYYYCISVKYNKKEIKEELLKQFEKYYNKKDKYPIKRKIKYTIFIKNPELISKIMLLRKRYKYT